MKNVKKAVAWEMDWNHNRFVRQLNCLVQLPATNDGGKTIDRLMGVVLRYGFAVQYSEGEHSLRVRKQDWKLINGLIQHEITIAI